MILDKSSILLQKKLKFSSGAGKIKKIFVAAPNQADWHHYEIIFGLRSALFPDCQLIVWCNSKKIADELCVFLNKRSTACRIIEYGEKVPKSCSCILIAPKSAATFYSKWVRDAFICSIKNRKEIVVCPSMVSKDSDINWSKNHISNLRFEDCTRLTHGSVSLPVAGGNFLSLGGTYLWGNNQLSSFQEGDKARAQTIGVFSTKNLLIGQDSGQNPNLLGHIDLFLTVTGCRSSISKQPIVLLGSVEKMGYNWPQQGDLWLDKLKNWLEQVSKVLREHALEVIRNPLPIIWNIYTNSFNICTQNNCLVEATKYSKTVWLPNIAQGNLDASTCEDLQRAQNANIGFWRLLGFEVCLLQGDYFPLFASEGGLHCITNELERIYSPLIFTQYHA